MCMKKNDQTTTLVPLYLPQFQFHPQTFNCVNFVLQFSWSLNYYLCQFSPSIFKVKSIPEQEALLAKLNWRFHSKQDAPWSQVLRRKYRTHLRLNSRNNKKLPCSQLWKGIKKGMNTFQWGARWTLGRESNLSFWHDKWSNLEPLRNSVQGPLLLEEINLKVKEDVKVGGWNWSKVSLDLPINVEMDIQAATSNDRLVRFDIPHGNFDLKSAYKLATKNDSVSFEGEWIWRIKNYSQNPILHFEVSSLQYKG